MTLTRRELLKYAGLAACTTLVPFGTHRARPVGKWILVLRDGTTRAAGELGRWRAIRWRDGGLEMGAVAVRAPDDERLVAERALAGTREALPPILDEWMDDGVNHRAFPDLGGVSVRQLWLDHGKPSGAPWDTLFAAIGDAFRASHDANVFATTTWKVGDFVLTWEGRLALAPPVGASTGFIPALIRAQTLARENLREELPKRFGVDHVMTALDRASSRVPSIDAATLRDFVRGIARDRFRDELALRGELAKFSAAEIVEIEKTGT